MDLQRISPPLTQVQKLTVVSIDALKLHQRVEEDDGDALIGDLIEAAFDYLSGPEGLLNGYCILEESFELYVDTLGARLELPIRRFVDGDLVSVERFDLTTGAYADLDVGLYTVVREDDFGVIASLSGRALGERERMWCGLDWNAWAARWPSPPVRKPRLYRIRFAAGAKSPDLVPSPLKQAIKLIAGYWYEKRESIESDPRTQALPENLTIGIGKLTGRYRVASDHS
ncbi:head-tail connector protein [Methylobacterium fujisawaense]|uniref:hypothetical protein n=1 Tax=Methylobacterium fujisawaense TaxID=107400 RepID=UPI00313D8CDF